jgi:hypothetical protein
MVPDKVINYMRAKNLYAPRTIKQKVLNILDSLGVDHSSEFAHYYLETYGLLISPKAIEDLLDIEQLPGQVRYACERYALPPEFIPITSDESEGMYMYNTKNHGVYDFDLAQYNDFMQGATVPRWKGFNEFLLWFVDDQNLDDIRMCLDDALLTEDEVDLIEKMVNMTTCGPWKSYVEGRDHTSGSNFIMTGTEDHRGNDIELTGATIADQDFIAASRQNVPLLVAEIRRLRKILNCS